MSHADTIREFLDQLRRINAETGASSAKQFMWKNRELVVEGLAENQRLRDALAGIARWTNPDTDTLEEVIAYARDALAGDTE